MIGNISEEKAQHDETKFKGLFAKVLLREGFWNKFHMDKIGFMIQYEGQWKTCKEGNWEFRGKKCKVAMVASMVSYYELVSTICSRIEIDCRSNDVILKFMYDPNVSMLPIEVDDEESLQFYLSLRDGKLHIPRPLCVTLPAVTNSIDSRMTPSVIDNEHDIDHVVPHSLRHIDHNGAYTSFDVEDDVGCDNLFQFGSNSSENNCNISRGEGDDDNEIIGVEEKHGIEDDLGRNSKGVIIDKEAGRDNNDENMRFHVEETRKEDFEGEMNDVEFNKELLIEAEELDGALFGVSIDNESYFDGELRVGNQFRSKLALQNKIALMAIKNNFEFQVNRSTKERYEVKCVNEGCNWRIRATKVQGTVRFILSRFTEPHTCLTNVVHNDNRHATSRLVGWLYKHMWDNGGRRHTPVEMVKDFKRKYGVELSYFKAWKAHKIALCLVRRGGDNQFVSQGKKRAKKCVGCGEIGHYLLMCKKPLPVNTTATTNE